MDFMKYPLMDLSEANNNMHPANLL